MNDQDNKSRFRHFIEGERLYMRDVKISDVNETYYRWMNDGEITQYTESRFYPNSEEALRAYVNAANQDSAIVFLAIVDKASDRHVGNIKLGPINWVHRFADLGIIIGEKEFWGKGYASEAIALMVSYAFQTLNLHKITAGCYASNVPSIKAFKRVGFTEDGIQRRHYFFDGHYVDLVCLGIVNET